MTQSQRQLRVGELVRHALSDILMRGGTYDPEIDRQPITVPEVRMSPDLKVATVFVMPLGGVNRDVIVKALARQAKPLRAQLARQIGQMKSIPELRFRLDTRFDDDDRMREALAAPVVVADLDDEGRTAPRGLAASDPETPVPRGDGPPTTGDDTAGRSAADAVRGSAGAAGGAPSRGLHDPDDAGPARGERPLDMERAAAAHDTGAARDTLAPAEAHALRRAWLQSGRTDAALFRRLYGIPLDPDA